MKQLFKKAHYLVIVLSILLVHTTAKAQESPLEGRWDLTVDMGGGRLAPSWLEVRHSGVKNLIGRFVAEGGSARPVAQVFFKDGKMILEEGIVSIKWEHSHTYEFGKMSAEDQKMAEWRIEWEAKHKANVADHVVGKGV
jgi:hypothetical protein